MKHEDSPKVKSLLEKFLKSQGVGMGHGHKTYIVLVLGTEYSEWTKAQLIPKLNKIYESVKTPKVQRITGSLYHVGTVFIYVSCDKTKPQFDRMCDLIEFKAIPFEDSTRMALIETCGIDTRKVETKPVCMVLDYHPTLLQVSSENATSAIMKQRHGRGKEFSLCGSWCEYWACCCGLCNIVGPRRSSGSAFTLLDRLKTVLKTVDYSIYSSQVLNF